MKYCRFLHKNKKLFRKKIKFKKNGYNNRNNHSNKKDKKINNIDEDLDYIFSLYYIKKRPNENVKDFIFYPNYMLAKKGV